MLSNTLSLKRLLSSPYYRLALPLLRRFHFARPSAFDWAAYHLERLNVPVTGILDVGAFDGTIALHLANLFPRAEIFSFEPAPASFALLEKTARQQPRIKPFRFAVGETNGQSFLNINRSPGTNSLLPIQPSRELEAVLGNGGETVERVPCETIRLDDFLPQHHTFHCALLKTDTQGFDLHVLRGAAYALQHSIRAVITEFRFYANAYQNDTSRLSSLDEYLATLGFQLMCVPSISPHPESRRAFEADGVWIRP